MARHGAALLCVFSLALGALLKVLQVSEVLVPSWLSDKRVCSCPTDVSQGKRNRCALTCRWPEMAMHVMCDLYPINRPKSCSIATHDLFSVYGFSSSGDNWDTQSESRLGLSLLTHHQHQCCWSSGTLNWTTVLLQSTLSTPGSRDTADLNLSSYKEVTSKNTFSCPQTKARACFPLHISLQLPCHLSPVTIALSLRRAAVFSCWNALAQTKSKSENSYFICNKLFATVFKQFFHSPSVFKLFHPSFLSIHLFNAIILCKLGQHLFSESVFLLLHSLSRNLLKSKLLFKCLP